MLNTDKMAYSIEEFAKVSNTCRDKLYDAIHSGALTARRSGRRTLILKEEAESYLKALPRVDPKDLKAPVPRDTASRGKAKRRLTPGAEQEARRT